MLAITGGSDVSFLSNILDPHRTPDASFQASDSGKLGTKRTNVVQASLWRLNGAFCDIAPSAGAFVSDEARERGRALEPRQMVWYAENPTVRARPSDFTPAILKAGE